MHNLIVSGVVVVIWKQAFPKFIHVYDCHSWLMQSWIIRWSTAFIITGIVLRYWTVHMLFLTILELLLLDLLVEMENQNDNGCSGEYKVTRSSSSAAITIPLSCALVAGECTYIHDLPSPVTVPLVMCQSPEYEVCLYGLWPQQKHPLIGPTVHVSFIIELKALWTKFSICKQMFRNRDHETISHCQHHKQQWTNGSVLS